VNIFLTMARSTEFVPDNEVDHTGLFLELLS
jgi:hypothetical protein